MEIYDTDRLVLKPTTEEDSNFILELMNTAKWQKFIGDRGVRTVKDAEKYISDNYVLQRERLGYSTFTVIRKIDEKKLGVVGLYDRAGLEGIDLGFAFLEKNEGQGYAFEASKMLVELSFNKFGLSELKAITNTDNLASQKLLVKLGFIKNGLVQLNSESPKVLLYTLHKQL
ncbi:Protein N-acetyltransferase, RimJ/RimL family [Spirosomataceae bacterium TFI 002]|nr:Protein N-acetyltransferase, RimJ/RimL family [Spirosomataceae bacterium TFI 002]